MVQHDEEIAEGRKIMIMVMTTVMIMMIITKEK
jgi:hypothetical protein